MSVSLMSLVWDRAPYEGGTLLVLLALADWADDEGVTWPSMATLAGKARMTIRNARYIMRHLEEHQMITREREGTGHLTTVYRLNVAALAAMPLAWKRPGPTPPVPAGEQNISASDYVPRQNLPEETHFPPEGKPISSQGGAHFPPEGKPVSSQGCADFPPEGKPVSSQGGNPLPPTHQRSTNEPKDPLPPAELGGEWLATPGDMGDQKPRPPDAAEVDRARGPHSGDFDRATIDAMLRTIWREWGCEEVTAGEPHAPPGATDHGPAP
jgi:hypothetical protein